MSRQKPTTAHLPRRSKAKTLTGVTMAALLASAGFPAAAQAAETYTEIPQSQMTITDVNSVETSGEGANGPAALVLDGDNSTYWHTKWSGSVDEPPHHFTVKLADEPIKLGKVKLTPRQSSNGSGRVHDYQLLTSTSPTCDESTFTLATQGAFGGEVTDALIDREITIPNGVDATCAQVVYLSTWGGKSGTNAISPVEKVGSLAEFKAYTLGDDGVVTPPEEPQPTVTLTQDSLSVLVHQDFPQIVGYNLDGHEVAGNTGAAINKVQVNATTYSATSTEAEVSQDGAQATWRVSVADLDDVAFDVTVTNKDGVIRYELSNLTDSANAVKQITIPGLNLVTLKGTDAGASVASTQVSVDRNKSGDLFETVSSATAGNRNAWLIVPSTSDVSFGLESNAIADHTSQASQPATGMTSKWLRKISGSGSDKVATVSPNLFTWLGAAAAKDGAKIGRDENPWIEIKPTLDANSDGKVNWQDGATALRDIRPQANGMEDVKNTVITRIPFNIVSQATHPFLRTLDDTKRISLATDGLGQQVMLKGYEAEGHDSAHPDYAGHYNTRAGGLEDLTTLVNEGESWNAKFGVHVNTTESYSESYNFSEDLLTMPPQAAWGWMNQSYYINSSKDLATGNVLERFQEFRDEVPENLSWLYIDVYYPDGWQAKRLGAELEKQGWTIGSEWSDKLPDQNIWSHWANDENYGGSSNKGINSQIFRFVDNSNRDIFNPDPVLGHSSTVEFEGWTGHVDYTAFIRNIWERNLPTKFLQQSNIRTWETGKVTFDNGTVATSPLTTISGSAIPTNREITYDGATVYTQGKYLLPWTDGEDRLYHLNPEGGSTQWNLTGAWAGQSSLTLYKLTDTGRTEIGSVPVTDGKISIEAEAGTPYVLYPSSTIPEVKAPDWGQASNIADPGFFSGTTDAYQTTGDIKVVKSNRGNFQAQVGAGSATISQKLAGGNLPAGKWNASAWVEIEQGKSRTVELTADGAGVKPVAHQTAVNGTPTTTFSTSTARNSTASDEKFRTYFQRARVTFETTGGEVNFAIKVGDGSAVVSLDDLRLTDFVPADAPASAGDGVVLFEDYENADTGYWPFVTGIAQGGDARTQLAERHEPYSQKGWYGKNTSGKVVEGGKIIDNVLDGTWSLMAHEENDGRILRTSEQTVNFAPGHKYEVSFDYQSGHANLYSFVVGYDKLNGSSAATTDVETIKFGQVRDTERFSKTFTAGACGSYFIAIDSNSSGSTPQGDLVLDNILIRDLGASDEGAACAQADILDAGSMQSGIATLVTTQLTAQEAGPITDIKHELTAPEGWTVMPVTSGESSAEGDGTSSATWLVVPAADATAGELATSISYKQDGSNVRAKVENTASVKVVTPLKKGENYLSDLPFSGTPTNGWGPVERDQANGEQGQGDGPALTLGGVEYEKGLGAHASSKITFDLSQQCTAFSALVGIDGKQTSRGSVVFTVQDGNGKVLAGPTQTMTPAVKPVELTADLTGVDKLVLVADQTSDGNGNDWADWVNAKISCDDGATTGATVTPASSSIQQGKVIDLALEGWSAENGDVELYDIATGAPLATTQVSSDGSATASLSIAKDAELGTVNVLALQESPIGLTAARTSFDVTKSEPPVVEPVITFVQQPQGAQVTAGGTAKFSAQVTTEPAGTFQWQVRKLNGQWTDVQENTGAGVQALGTTNTQLELKNLDISYDKAAVRLAVTAGTKIAYSNEAALTVVLKDGTVAVAPVEFVKGKKPVVEVRSSTAGTATITVSQGAFTTTAKIAVAADKSVKATLPKALPSSGKFTVSVSIAPTSSNDKPLTAKTTVIAKNVTQVTAKAATLVKGRKPVVTVKATEAGTVKVSVSKGSFITSKSVKVAAGKSVKVTLPAALKSSGTHAVTAVLTPSSKDSLGSSVKLKVSAKQVASAKVSKSVLVKGKKPVVTVKANTAGTVKVTVSKGSFSTTKSVKVSAGKSVKLTLPKAVKKTGKHTITVKVTPKSSGFVTGTTKFTAVAR